eukprot:Pgem_evm1s1281
MSWGYKAGKKVFFMNPPETLTHQQTVMRMYRQGLREARNWNTAFEDYRADCLSVRAHFDEHMHLTNPKE